jgi:hypothetical protein
VLALLCTKLVLPKPWAFSDAIRCSVQLSTEEHIEREEKTYLPLPDKTKEECGVFVPQVMFNTSVYI